MGNQTKLFISMVALTLFVALGSGSPLIKAREKFEVQSQNQLNGPKEDPLVFISYRRTTSRHLARLVKELLEKQNISAVLDVNEIEDGTRSTVHAAANFIIILSVDALDLCIGDTNYDDYLHKEIRDAVHSNSTLIIPIFDEYNFPNENLYSAEIQTMLKYQGVTWEHALADGSIRKLIRYLQNVEPPSEKLIGNSDSISEKLLSNANRVHN